MRLDIYHHFDPQVEARLRTVEHLLDLINRKLENIMATLDETLAKVTASGDRLDSLILYVNGLKQQLADALSGTTLPAGVQAKIDAIFAEATENADKTDAALNANVPLPA